MVIEFADAQRHWKLCQPFIDSLDLDWARPFIKRVLYVHEDTDDDGAIMATHFKNKSYQGKAGGQSTVRVYNGAFHHHSIRRMEDLLSEIRDHEGKHAQLIYEQPEVFAVDVSRRMRKIRKVIEELICHSCVFQRFATGQADLSRKHVRFLLEHMAHYRLAFDELLEKPKYRKRIESPLVRRMMDEYWAVQQS